MKRHLFIIAVAALFVLAAAPELLAYAATIGNAALVIVAVAVFLAAVFGCWCLIESPASRHAFGVCEAALCDRCAKERRDREHEEQVKKARSYAKDCRTGGAR